jgi:hypothetical protein
MTAAITQPAAMYIPPKRIQRMFSTIETGGMRCLCKMSDAFAPGDIPDPMPMDRTIKPNCG